MISQEPTLRASSQHLQVQLRTPSRVADFSLHVDANAPRVCGVRGESIDYAGTRKFAHNHPRTRHYVQWCASSTGPLAPSLRPTPSSYASRQSEYLSSPRGMIYDGHRARADARVATFDANSPVTSPARASTCTRPPSETPGTCSRGPNMPRFQLFDPRALSWDAPALRYMPPTGPTSEEMSSKEPPACESARTSTCFRVPRARLESPRRQVALQNCGANGARVAEMAVAWGLVKGLVGPSAEG
jgi:hypothetical protein